MHSDGPENEQIFKAVVNHEEQYSIWPAAKPNPGGWRDAGKEGSKQECLAYIGEAWIDMTPRSVRTRLES